MKEFISLNAIFFWNLKRFQNISKGGKDLEKFLVISRNFKGLQKYFFLKIAAVDFMKV